MSQYATAVDDSLYDGAAGPPVKQDGLYIRFHLVPVENKLKSWGGDVVRADGTVEHVQGEGRLVCDDVEYIEKMVPGDKTNVIDRPVREEDRRQYARQYAAWKAGQQEQVTGTPLTHWPHVTRAQVEELGYFKIRTVEQLANVSDANLQNVGPLLDLRQRARDFLALAQGAAPLETLRTQVNERDNRIQALEQQLKELAEHVAKKGKGKTNESNV